MEKISPMPVRLLMPPWQQGLSGIPGSLPRAFRTSGDRHCLACRTGCLLAMKARALPCSEAVFWFPCFSLSPCLGPSQPSSCPSPLPLHYGATMATISQTLSEASPGVYYPPILHLQAYGASLHCKLGALCPSGSQTQNQSYPESKGRQNGRYPS